MTSVFGQASGILDGSLQVPVHSVRAAAWLTRSGLEDLLVELVQRKGCDTDRASTRTLLSCIDSLYADDHPELAATLQYAWDQLTQASHHHAYELAPTLDEVRTVLNSVAAIQAELGSPTQSAATQPTE